MPSHRSRVRFGHFASITGASQCRWWIRRPRVAGRALVRVVESTIQEGASSTATGIMWPGVTVHVLWPPIRANALAHLRGSRLSVGRDRRDRGGVGDRADAADQAAVWGCLGTGSAGCRRASRLPLVEGASLTVVRWADSHRPAHSDRAASFSWARGGQRWRRSTASPARCRLPGQHGPRRARRATSAPTGGRPRHPVGRVGR